MKNQGAIHAKLCGGLIFQAFFACQKRRRQAEEGGLSGDDSGGSGEGAGGIAKNQAGGRRFKKISSFLIFFLHGLDFCGKQGV